MTSRREFIRTLVAGSAAGMLPGLTLAVFLFSLLLPFTLRTVL